MSRPTKRTPQVETAILDALRRGNTRAAASESAGIDRTQLWRWMERSATFRNAVTRAEAEAEVKAVGAVHDAYAEGDWRAGLEWLKRRRSADWSDVQRIEIIDTVREMARAAGLDEDAAIAEAERFLKESAVALAASPPEAVLLRLHMRAWEAAQQRAERRWSALDWAREHATIMLPGTGRVPFEPYAYQAAYLEDRSRRRLILKARQVGMSNAVAIEALYRALTTRDRQVLMISRGGLYAQQLVTYCRHALSGLKRQPEITQENLTTLAFANGSRIISLPASPSTGRGFPASDLYLDEFAFAMYDQMIYESAVPALAPDGNLTVLSTANGRANMYFRLWAGLEGGEWSRHTIHWSDCPRYDDDWAERQRRNMTRQAFAQEYDCDFVASGDNVFDAADLVAARQGWDRSPVGCDEIITAWDIGRRQDHTVGISIGRRGDVWHEVAFERMLVPYPVVQSSIEKRHRALKGRTYVESNGVGDPVIENLAVRVEPFATTAKTKTQAVQALQLLIQQGRFKYGSDQLDRELGLYQWHDAALIQDAVMAAAIAAFHVVQPQRAVYVY